MYHRFDRAPMEMGNDSAQDSDMGVGGADGDGSEVGERRGVGSIGATRDRMEESGKGKKQTLGRVHRANGEVLAEAELEGSSTA
ncbi:MAG: hypothetical protein GY721_09370 [Deltaproteobacteria bacterium]|nr:hypothetical protein [Deltaproteobacteria bacterium]